MACLPANVYVCVCFIANLLFSICFCFFFYLFLPSYVQPEQCLVGMNLISSKPQVLRSWQPLWTRDAREKSCGVLYWWGPTSPKQLSRAPHLFFSWHHMVFSTCDCCLRILVSRCGLHPEAGGPVPCIWLSPLVPVSPRQVQSWNGQSRYSKYPLETIWAERAFTCKSSLSLWCVQQAVQRSGERNRSDEKLQQTIQLSIKRLESYQRVSLRHKPIHIL